MVKCAFSFAYYILITVTCSQAFVAYWNVPSSTCNQFGIYFNLSQYGIIQNENDEFFGDQLGILYEPVGLFPAYLLSSLQKTYVARNGGIPQLGNMTAHFEELGKLIDLRFPDKKFSGLGILDFESWRPLWRQNYVSNPNLNIYRTESIAHEQQRYPCWTPQQQEREAERRFELFARAYMERTLNFTREMRPKATWGYYSYPFCFNYSPANNFDCPISAKQDNDDVSWLFSASGGLFPSAYVSTMDPKEHRDLIIWARMEEGKRVAGDSQCGVTPHGPDVLPYIRYRYVDKDIFLSDEDLSASLRAAICLNLRGVVIWGSSTETNTLEKCQKLSDYVNSTLGPFVHAATVIGKGQKRRSRKQARGKCSTTSFPEDVIPSACPVPARLSMLNGTYRPSS